MKCMICKNGVAKKSTTTVTLERDGSTIVFQKVPALVCDNCGESYLEEEITSALLQKANEIIAGGAKVDIREYQLDAA